MIIFDVDKDVVYNLIFQIRDAWYSIFNDSIVCRLPLPEKNTPFLLDLIIEYISDFIILWPLNEQNSSLNISVNISTHLGKFLHTTIVLYRGVIN